LLAKRGEEKFIDKLRIEEEEEKEQKRRDNNNSKMHHKSSDIMQSITMDQSPIPDVTMESDQNNNNENSSNNNLSMKKNEKYSLRQRGQRKSISSRLLKSSSVLSSDASIINSNADNSDEQNTKSKSRLKAVTKEKPKQRAAPLSKYRRKTANARERTRMREINHAFETLRHSVPVVISGSQSQNTNEKLTKITTLRMAMKYIKILNDIIENKAEVSEGLLAALNNVDDSTSTSSSSEKLMDMIPFSIPSPSPSNTSSSSSSSSSTYLTFSKVVVSKSNRNSKEKFKSSGNVLAQNHHDYCKEIIRESNVKPVKPAKANVTKKSAKANNNTTSTTSKVKKSPKTSVTKTPRNSYKNHQQQPPPLAPPIHRRQNQRTNKIENKLVNHLLGGGFNQTMLHSASLNNNNNNNNINLNCLNKYDLSPCLTPPNDDPTELGLILESDGESLQLSEPCFSPLEFGLLLESDGESLHLSEPCLSPLNNLDALNSFNDLLQSSFGEPNSLEMYLS
jgi:delilah